MDFMLKLGDFKKRFCRYLLHHYLGQYLQEKFTLDQLTVDLYNGKGNVKNVQLDCRALNQVAEEQNIPVEFLEVHLGSISVSIPWMTIMQDSCQIEVSGLEVTIQPKKRIDNGNSMLNSMFNSMASSIVLAEEFLKTVEVEEDLSYQSQNMPGLEACAKTIETVLARVKVSFQDSVVRIEKSGATGIGVAMQIKIKSWSYSDESGNEIGEDRKMFETAFSYKKFYLEGIQIFSDIFKTQNDQNSSEEDDPDNLIWLANFTGRHEIGVKIKKDESMGGPQLSLECNFGSLVALLSPVQAHILFQIAEEFFNPSSSPSTENLSLRNQLKEKPMEPFDYQRIKEELEETNRRDAIGLPRVQQQHQGWSSSFADDCDDEFLPFKTKQGLFSSVHSTIMDASMISGTSSLENSMTESTTTSIGIKSSSALSYMNSPRKSPSGTTGASSTSGYGNGNIEKTKFSVTIASAAVTLLHEDILTLSSSMAVAPSTAREMRDFATKFFDVIGICYSSAMGRAEVKNIKQRLDEACPNSCLRLIAAPIKIEGNLTTENSLPITVGSISFGYFELSESLKDNAFGSTGCSSVDTDLLTFPHTFGFTDHRTQQQQQPSLKVTFKHKAYRSRASATKTEIRVHLQECFSEFDMSIVDRLHSLLNPKLPFLIQPRWELGNTVMSLNNKSQSVVFLKISSPKCVVDFRFPIPDMRKSDDENKVPYWTRNVRPDSIVFHLKELTFNTCINSNSSIYELDTKCQECQLFYKAKPQDKPLHFATASAQDSDIESASLQGFDWPRVVVWIFPETKAEIPDITTRQEEDDSIANVISLANFKSAPSPFSSRRVVHECLSSNPEEKNSGSFGESVIPGDREETNKFIEDTTKNTLYKVECQLRCVVINMPSKDFFEEVYNRLSMDLLLWEPLAPKQTDSLSGNGNSFRDCQGPQQFSMCKSGLRLDADDEDSEEELGFYTASSNLNNQKIGGKNKRRGSKRILPQGQSEVTINLVITKGVCSFFTPFEDVLGNIVPEQKGQIILEIEQGNLFIVSGYKGNRNLGYLSIHSQRARFYHCELVKVPDLLPKSDSQMRRTIYPSEEGILSTRSSSDSTSNKDLDMLSVAIKIERDEIKNIKNFKVAVGIKDGTIDYHVVLPNRTWFTQIVDFFDVTDVCVAGYTPSIVITELHVHLWNCAASYVPLNLPMRSVLTVENFTVSLNIAAQTNMKVFRIIAEDAAFYLSNKKESNDLRNDYVCIFDMDLFELLVRICTNRNASNNSVPQLDFKASNNVLHIRTCSDSVKMFLELLTYFARDGDLAGLTENPDEFLYSGRNSESDSNSKVPAFISTNPPAFGNDFMDAESHSISMGQQQQMEQRERERRLSHHHQTEQLYSKVAEAMQENLEMSSQPKSKSASTSPYTTTNNKPYIYPNLENVEFNSFSHQYRKTKQESIEVNFDSGNQYNEEKEQEGEEDDDDDSNEDDEEVSNVSTPAPPRFRDPIMESCDGLPVTIQMSDEDEEDFCILENDPGVGFLPRSGEPEIRVLTEKPIELVDNYFSVPMGKVDILQAPKHYPKPIVRFTIQEMSVVWHLYDGEDFGNSSNTSKSSNKTGSSGFRGSSETLSNEYMRGDSYDPYEVDIAVDALNPGVAFSKVKAFESPWEAYSPKTQRRQSLDGGNSWRAAGGKGRRHDTLVELQLSKIKFQHEVYPQHTEQAARQVLVINNVEILDKLRSSLFNKMLYLYTSPTMPKQSFANMVVIKAAHTRPDPQLNIEECSLKISLLPIRLNIDQNTILFLYQFFNDLSTVKLDSEEDDSLSSIRPPSHTPSVESLPVMMVNTKEGGTMDDLANNVPSGSSTAGTGAATEDEDSINSPIFTDTDEPPSVGGNVQDDNVSVSSKDPSLDSFKSSAPIYFREIIFSPEVPMRLDYRGQNVYDMTNGPIAGILMALGQLESAEIRLIRLTNNRGVLGIGKLMTYLGNEWIQDIRKHQVPNVLGGVDIFIPMHSFVQLFQGVKNLFCLPVEQYQKDGRLAKGLQRGVNAFSTSAAMAALKLTNRMVQAFQGAAEFTYDMVSPGPSVQEQRRLSSKKKRYSRQPSDIREGMANAYNVVKEGLGDTTRTMVRVASKENEQKGYSGAISGVVRQIPPTLIVKPIIHLAEATSSVLEGFRSQLEPEVKKEAEDKWKKSGGV